MSEVIKKEELDRYIDGRVFKFENAGHKDVVSFEFPFKATEDVIDYIEPGCGCTKAWFEDGKICGTLTIANVGGLNPEGSTAINKVVTVMLDPGERYLIAGEKKVKRVNEKKRFIKLTLAGTCNA